MIKQGDVAFVKTTGEAVYVMDFTDPSPKIGDKDLQVQVRRPVAGQDGIRHQTEYFQLGELETQDEQRKRFMADREEMLAKYAPKISNESPSFSA